MTALRRYYTRSGRLRSHFSRFVSFALVSGPPPDFRFELRRDDLPPEALTLEGFNTILGNFYSEAKLEELWQHYQPDYQGGIESLRSPVSELVFSVSNYLREIVRSNSGRSFSVYVEPLAGGKTIFKTFGDQYALVVRPAPSLQSTTFVTPSCISCSIPLQSGTGCRRPRLRVCWRSLRTPRSFPWISAMIFRRSLTNAWFEPWSFGCAIFLPWNCLRRSIRPKVSASSGSSIYAGLSGFEKSEPAMGYYLPDLIKGIDVGRSNGGCAALSLRSLRRQIARLPKISRWQRKRLTSSNPLDDDLAEGQRQISARTAPRPPLRLSVYSPPVRMTNVPLMDWQWLPRCRASRIRPASYLQK